MAAAIQAERQLGTSDLEQLQMLASEIENAMTAIASNALSSLEESIARQEMLCAGLSAMPGFASGDLATASRTRSAADSLLKLNLQYAALLKHSGRSITLLSALCKTHTGQSQEAGGPRLKHQTWSCQM